MTHGGTHFIPERAHDPADLRSAGLTLTAHARMRTVIPEAGELVGGVYRVLGPLGSGAMGVVLLAYDESLGRRVAVKFVLAQLLGAGFREKLALEARAMARVSHPNTLQIHAFGDHEGAPFFVMEYVDGVTLDVWMKRHPKPDLDLALAMLTQICLGVAAIHDAGTVHRDIKPSNILVDEKERPYIADLGLAILLRRGGAISHEIVGTPAYMAPEVAFPSMDDDGLRGHADVYSLACVAYELLTGHTPFAAQGGATMMLRHAAMPAPPPSTFRADLPRSLDAAILCALAKKPAERTPTVEAFRTALEAVRAETLHPTRILIADDNDTFRELLATGLEEAFPSAQIECARDGRAALDAFDRSRPSIMIFDLRMPSLDGMALAKLLRARDPEALVPMLVLTGAGGPEEWAVLSDLGVTRLLVKPVALEDVVSIIQRLMRDQSKRVAG